MLNHDPLGGSLAGLNSADMMRFVRRVSDGAVLTLETLKRHVYPMSAMAPIANA